MKYSNALLLIILMVFGAAPASAMQEGTSTTTDLLKDLVNILDEHKDQESFKTLFHLKSFFKEHSLSLAQLATLINEAQRLEIMPIAQAAAWQLYKTQSEYTKKEFAALGITRLADCKLCAITTTDDRLFILPEEIAATCPYLHTFCNSLYKESKQRCLELPQEYSSDTVAFIKQLIEMVYEHKVLKNNESDQIKPLIEAHLQKQEHLSTDAILLADQWLMPELAHLLTQFMFANVDRGQQTEDLLGALPSSCRYYIPPTKHDDQEWLKGREGGYLRLIAEAHKLHLCENDEAITKTAKTSISLCAENFDAYVKNPTFARLFKQPNMQKFAELLKEELLKRNSLHNDCTAVKLDSYAIKSLVNLGKNRLLATTKYGTTAYILDATTAQTRCSIGGFFENVVAANRFDDTHIITASYIKSDHVNRGLARSGIYGSMLDKNVIVLTLKLWGITNDKPTCQREMKEPLFAGNGYPKIKHLSKLDEHTVLAQVGHKELLLWDIPQNSTRTIDLDEILKSAASKKIAVLDAARLAVLYKHRSFENNKKLTASLGILDLPSQHFTRFSQYYDCNAMKTLPTLMKFDSDHIVTCAHEDWVGSDGIGQAHFPTTKRVEINTGKNRILWQQEPNKNLWSKKPPFSTIKINDKQIVSTGTKTAVINQETDIIEDCIIDEPRNPSRCAVSLGNGRVAVGMSNGQIKIITANALLSLQEIIKLRKEQLKWSPFKP